MRRVVFFHVLFVVTQGVGVAVGGEAREEERRRQCYYYRCAGALLRAAVLGDLHHLASTCVLPCVRASQPRSWLTCWIMRCVLGMAAEVDAAAPGGGEGAGGVRSRCGRGALHLAAANGRTHVCRFLLEGLGLPVDALSASGAPPSRPAAAARSSHVSSMLAERLISCSVFDAAAHAGETPLLLAATFGHTSTAAYLLDRGADPSTPDPNGGDTPLHWAAYNGAYVRRRARVASRRGSCAPCIVPPSVSLCSCACKFHVFL